MSAVRSLKLTIKGEPEAAILGACLGSILRKGDIVLLKGELGAGKTTLVRYCAKHLGIDPRLVTSPTFSIIHLYPNENVPIAHVDLYRLGVTGDYWETGVMEVIEEGKYCVFVEWGEYLSDRDLGDLSPLVITLEFGGGEGSCQRIVHLQGAQSTWGERIEAIATCMNKEEQ